MTVKGKVALVTGSTSGIGLAIATAMAQAGADVMLNGFGDAAAIETLRGNLARSAGVRVGYSAADMSKAEQVAGLVAETERQFGRLDVLVNNAGVQHTANVEDFPPERWEAILSINLSSSFYAIRAALPGMKRRGFGRIINIASVHGLVASVQKAAYVAAKHGLIGLTKVVALETARTPVTCNAICPGFVLTPLVEKQILDRAQRDGVPQEEAKVRLLSEKMPSAEAVAPEALAQLALYLCSPAADQIRGAALPVDGAWTAQ
ncbi:MAG: 3-hydroxybutyrate dehydrogenase [Alphaproteobacteria bacterium]|nr:3-hydroxybutyrate dehydrogenase [Alphaproteobacteria bacterium]